MELKKEIEKLLNQLKDLGYGRDEIEKEYEYSDNYISQALSRGGNTKLLTNLKKLHSKALQAKPAPGDNLNPERAMVMAILDDYASWKGSVTGEDPDKIKSQVHRKAHLILGGLDAWPLPSQR